MTLTGILKTNVVKITIYRKSLTHYYFGSAWTCITDGREQALCCLGNLRGSERQVVLEKEKARLDFCLGVDAGILAKDREKWKERILALRA